MDDEKRIDWLLHQNEGQYLEFKQSVSDNLGRAICGFANSTGGALIVGVRADGMIKGISDPSAVAANIQNIARTCKPPINVNISYFVREGKTLLLVDVPKSDSGIHQFGSGFYSRSGPMTQAMNREELEALFWKAGRFRFEEKSNAEFRYPRDFDAEAFRIFLLKSGVSPPKNRANMLMNLGLVKKDGDKVVFNNAGVLFFAREPVRFIRHCPVDCLLFSGWDKVNILDRKTLEGNLIENVDGAMAFLRKNLRLRYEIKTLQREEILELPEDALREALLNAVIHRDYSFEGSYVTVEIFRDRVEISNPGGLAPGLQPEDFGKKTVRRNPLLAETFHRMGEIEKVGSGVGRMLAAVKAAGLPRPKFEFTTFFTVTFRRPGEDARRPGRVRAGVQVEAQVELSDIGRRILRMCAEPKSTRELLDALGHKRRSGAFDHAMEVLLSSGLVAYTLPDRPRSKKQRYIITKAGRGFIEASSKTDGKAHD